MNYVQVVDILENHAIEKIALERQLSELNAEYAADLDEIRNRVYPKAQVYDTDKIQAAPKPIDERYAAMIAAVDLRRERYEQETRLIKRRLTEIQTVYTTIHQLNATDKVVLLNLYYPYQTIEQVAEMMGLDRSTIRNRKKTALENLLKKI